MWLHLQNLLVLKDVPLDGSSQMVIGSMGWLFHLLTTGGFMGVRNPLILTIDPNFLGHPSGGTATEGLKNPHVVGQD